LSEKLTTAVGISIGPTRDAVCGIFIKGVRRRTGESLSFPLIEVLSFGYFSKKRIPVLPVVVAAFPPIRHHPIVRFHGIFFAGGWLRP
jgi:hypothetical protein